MSLHYILDGYNIIKRGDFLIKNKLKDARSGLIKLIKENRLCGSKRNSVTIVFDGRPDIFFTKFDSEVEIIFTKNESADDKIKLMVEGATNPRHIVVVSDDKQIQLSVGSLGARAMSVQTFIHRQKHNDEANAEAKEELPANKARLITEELKKVWLR